MADSRMVPMGFHNGVFVICYISTTVLSDTVSGHSLIRVSYVDALYNRDGAGQISRDPRTKHH